MRVLRQSMPERCQANPLNGAAGVRAALSSAVKRPASNALSQSAKPSKMACLGLPVLTPETAQRRADLVAKVANPEWLRTAIEDLREKIGMALRHWGPSRRR